MILDRLEQLAEKAPAGPWEAVAWREPHAAAFPRMHVERNRQVLAEVFATHSTEHSTFEDVTADKAELAVYLAALDPQTVKALIGVARAVMRMRPWHHLGDDDIADIRAAIQALEAL